MIGTKAEGETKVKALAMVFLVAALTAACVLLAANPTRADSTFFVNSTKDRADESPGDGSCYTGVRIIVEDIFIVGECTLRAAIQEANALAGADTINFGIESTEDPNCDAATGVCTISPATALPAITRPATIDGYSQGGASENTLTQPGKTNAVLKIELDGTGAGTFPSGLVIDGDDASNSVIRGLVINNFGNHGIYGLDDNGPVKGVRVEGNFIGADPSGTSVAANGTGVHFGVADGSTIGGTSPEDRNLISGNAGPGVSSFGGGPSYIRIQGNLIGTNRNGGLLGNGAAGVLLPSAARGNSRILSNSIYSNNGIGIDLVGGTENAAGVTLNDPDDPDTGPNTLQNFPGISSATTSGGSTTIKGALNSTLDRTFTIQFFASPAPDSSGFGEGKTFIGQRSVTTNLGGNAPFEFVFDPAIPVGRRVTATATGAGGTSEFSRARIVVRPAG